MTWSRIRPMPDDFAEHAHESENALVKRYNTGTRAIQRWRAEMGGEPRRSRRIVTPADVERIRALMADGLNSRQIARCIGFGSSTICRAVEKHSLGPWPVKAKKEPEPRPEPKPRVVCKSTKPRQLPTWKPAPVISYLSNTEAGKAADYLRRFGAVWRCNGSGAPSPSGRYWRRGSAILTDAEIIERAEWLRGREGVA